MNHRITLASLLVLCVNCSQVAQDSRTPRQTHQAIATKYYRTFSAAHPVLKRVKPGDTVVTKTLDAGGQDEKDLRRSEPGNPLTGPFFVEGAEAGDALVVRF